jgi:hypothetical protein
MIYFSGHRPVSLLNHSIILSTIGDTKTERQERARHLVKACHVIKFGETTLKNPKLIKYRLEIHKIISLNLRINRYLVS